ncbi:Putative receptor-like protein kinase [Glycine soja]|uniref:Putative receptor-like protein kinase n=1 Tax=Glycine soja TaxID=3848 RepID=A0A0B2PBW0_GLYSO|nr:Putative receptor-like protein kinase [Glycine soja]
MWRQSALLVFLLLLVHQICATNEQEHACPPSSCGKITNITYPFRLRGDPKGCGDNRYELACENNVTVLYSYSGKYHVQAINYNNFTIRVVDPGVQQPNCSSLPRYFLSPTNFSDSDNFYLDRYQIQNRCYPWKRAFQKHIIFLNCRHAVIDNEKYVETDPCIKWHSKGYIYAIAGDLIAKDFEVGCEVKLVAPTSWWGLDTNNSSYTQMHRALLYGFELSWINLACVDQCGNPDCAFDAYSQKLQCSMYFCRNFLGGRRYFIEGAKGLSKTIRGPNPELEREIGAYDSIFIIFGHYILPFLADKFLFGMTLFIVLLIYKWRKRHLSIYENIENYLEQNNLMPIGYSYKEIKKMARGFKDKLGEGGYGFVFKGKLRSGPSVAIKMLHKAKDIEMEGVIEEENKIAKKMIIVSLWCIQLKPSDRPSMNKVVEMLEGDIESLEIPPKPSLYPHETMENDQSIYSSQTMSTDFISSSSYSKEIVTNPLVEDTI